jgi:hypothetical protein
MPPKKIDIVSYDFIKYITFNTCGWVNNYFIKKFNPAKTKDGKYIVSKIYSICDFYYKKNNTLFAAYKDVMEYYIEKDSCVNWDKFIQEKIKKLSQSEVINKTFYTKYYPINPAFDNIDFINDIKK